MEAINFTDLVKRMNSLTDEQFGKVCRAIYTYLETGVVESVGNDIQMALELGISLATTKRNKRFIPPTLDEVLEYASTRKGLVDAHFFYEYYTDMKWKDKSGQPVLNWKGRFLTWENRAMKDLVKENNKIKLKDGKNDGEFDIG